MFIVTDTFRDLPFIQHAECGYLHNNPALKFCRVHFARTHLQDALFNQYAVPFPSALAGAVVKRKAEYLAGRYCAHYLLRQAGCLEPVLSAADRAPVWPAGWRGSVSHSEDIAIAVVIAEADGLYPGVDIEHLQPEIMLESADMFVSKTEQTLLSCCGLDMEWALLLAFSAKESLFKALYPRVQQMFDFDAAAIVALDPVNQRFTLRLNKTLSDAFAAGSPFSGEYHFSEGTVLTCLC
ncbi:4'-phosphopantetheinyl transferase family protein [Klebsiella aerogenes]|uniref:4'-phosphopantetheinyl transferase family protein n=1 Tax=Klebsiella aerogenes TaxID=548 RepID=UPI0022792E3F|nr:4'-phosphopantetheinyl transferase superfamily protein [Klebsiella aerogenes]MCY4766017.1 4'-phosphopantetheinyl transferase superfamily protein [Klebsiella aerogenes]